METFESHTLIGSVRFVLSNVDFKISARSNGIGRVGKAEEAVDWSTGN